MQVSDAVDLIIGSKIDKKTPETWADLGCGEGVFTRALTEILPERSTVYAVDQVGQSFDSVSGRESAITFIQADFEKAALNLPPLNGILMANSLHYVADKTSLLLRLQTHLVASGAFVIVEYDNMNANPWVPFPIDYPHLKKLFASVGFGAVEKLGERKSLYRRAKLYASIARRD